MKYAIGVDLGGTNIVSILINENGKILARDKRSTEGLKGKDHVLERITESINAVSSVKCQVSRPKKLKSTTDIIGIGIGTPGLVDMDKGIVFEAPNIPDWDNVNLSKIYRDKFGLPTFIENDANSAALGEWWIGAGKGTKNLICLTLGTGIGGGIIIDGKVYHGRDGYAGELGHISLSFDGPECGCGNPGCLEAYASAIGILKRTKTLLKDKKNKKSRILKLAAGQISNITPAIITQAAKNGDMLAKKIWKDTGFYLGSGIASIINIFNPEIIVLTGGITGAGSLLFKSMWETVRRRAYKNPLKNLDIVKGKLPENAGAVGAAKTAFQRIENNN